MSFYSPGLCWPIVLRRNHVGFSLHIQFHLQVYYADSCCGSRVHKGVRLNIIVNFVWLDLYWNKAHSASLAPVRPQDSWVIGTREHDTPLPWAPSFFSGKTAFSSFTLCRMSECFNAHSLHFVCSICWDGLEPNIQNIGPLILKNSIRSLCGWPLILLHKKYEIAGSTNMAFQRH